MSIFDQIAAGFQTPDMGGSAGDPSSGGMDPAPDGSQRLDYAGAEAQVGNASSLLAAHGAASAEAANPTQPIQQIVTNFGEDGEPSFDLKGVSSNAAEYIQQMMGIAQGTLAAKQGLIDRLSAKRDVLEAHPAIAQIGRVASAAATSYNAPNLRGIGLIHGAGAAGGEYFKDTPESLQAQIAGTEASKMHDVAPVEAALQAEQRTQAIAGKQTALEEQRRVRDLTQRMGSLVTQAANGVVIPPGTATKIAQSFHAKPEEAAAYEQQIQDANAGYVAKKSAQDKETAANYEAHQAAELRWADLRERHRMQIEQEFGNDPRFVPKDNQMRKIEDEYGKLSDASSKGGQDVQHWAGVMQAAGVNGFNDKTTISDAAKKIDMAFRTGKVSVQGSSNAGLGGDDNGTVPLSNVLASVYGTTGDKITPKQLNDLRKEVANSADAYQNFQTRAPQLEALHEATRQSLPKNIRDGIPSLKPGGYIPTAPVMPAQQGPPAPAPAAAAAPAQPPAQPAQRTPVWKTKDGRMGKDAQGWFPISPASQ